MSMQPNQHVYLIAEFCFLFFLASLDMGQGLYTCSSEDQTPSVSWLQRTFAADLERSEERKKNKTQNININHRMNSRRKMKHLFRLLLTAIPTINADTAGSPVKTPRICMHTTRTVPIYRANQIGLLSSPLPLLPLLPLAFILL